MTQPGTSFAHRIFTVAIALAVLLASLWTAAALYFDVRIPVLRWLSLLAYLTFLIGNVWGNGFSVKALRWWSMSFLAILGWWLSIPPSNDRNWQADVAQMARADIHGDIVTIHNVRNVQYRTELDYTPRWESREIPLSSIQHIDLFITHWGSPLIAHAILSFEYGGGRHIAMSIEARKQVGQSYSAIRGFFRQYGLIYIAADERDVVRVRTNYRKGEYVRLYRTKTTAKDAQALFLQYTRWINDTYAHPEWYNAFTNNCTSSVSFYLARAKVGGVSLWDWRNVLNGKGDEMLYQLGDLETGNLPFAQLTERALINPEAQRIGDAPDFSARIRQGRPGFN